jgi:hypothetical protein
MVVNQNGLEERWDHVGIDHFKIVRLLHIGVNELKDLLLNGAKSTDFRRLGGNASYVMSTPILCTVAVRRNVRRAYHH